ncbi:MAG: TetR/AcrR family transcriptional regulator [Bacteroidota bacterium]|nr:TetR/AcrR family transcriptional regulator [Bacteroidota bacterium]
MIDKNKNTEEKILDAANEVFIEKGFDGARMQQIADKAKINKSLLHYYYRSKDKLFTQVFKIVSKKFFPKTISIFSRDIEFYEKIRIFTSEYIDVLSKNPFLPMFILHEISKNPQKIASIFINIFDSNIKKELANIGTQLEEEYKKGNIKKTKPKHFIINTLSLCVFPFVGKPIITSVILNGSNEEFNTFIEERKTQVAEFIINSIKK